MLSLLTQQQRLHLRQPVRQPQVLLKLKQL
ncbi:hypothetical protein YPPY09_3104, partial [Yersinia pestis PY-09]